MSSCMPDELFRFIPSNGKRKIGSRHETAFATTKKPLDASPRSPGKIQND